MIRISSYVDNPVASHLNRESGRLDFTLILHVALGKDYFISVTGQYREFRCKPYATVCISDSWSRADLLFK